MVLIFGGAYQGKLEYVLNRFELSMEDVIFCTEKDYSLPCGKKVICDIDKWILALIKAGQDVSEAVGQFQHENPDAIVICNDISCGVVPMDPVMRKWRDETGRFMGRIAQHAIEVVRLYCGIPTVLKGGIKP